MSSERFARAIALIDDANAEDPNIEEGAGTPRPRALLYGQRRTDWLERPRPNAPEPLRLAARAQHIRRWTSRTRPI